MNIDYHYNNKYTRAVRNLLPAGTALPGTYRVPLQIAVGTVGTGIFGTLSSSLLISAVSLGTGLAGATFLAFGCMMLPFTAGSILLLRKGLKDRKKYQRFKEYFAWFKGRSYLMYEDLHKQLGFPVKQIREDIRYLHDSGSLPGIRIDDEETCLLLTTEAIEQYEAAKESQKIREQEEALKKTEEERWANASEEEKEFHRFTIEAETSLNRLRGFRQSISNPEMLKKLDQLELSISRIFVCIRQHPEKLRSADRLISYYIPTIIGLLTVYDDLEDQPIQGETITKTKNEIETSMDTINEALETMFDELFQDELIDVSADIQVLRTMLAQDGLTESPLKR